MNNDESGVSPEENTNILFEGEGPLPTDRAELRQLQVGYALHHSGIDTLREGSPVLLMVKAIFDAFLFVTPSRNHDGTIKESRTTIAERIAGQTFPSTVYVSPKAVAFAQKRARQALRYGSDRIKLRQNSQ